MRFKSASFQPIDLSLFESLWLPESVKRRFVGETLDYYTLRSPDECRYLLKHQTSSALIPEAGKVFSGVVEHDRFALQLVATMSGAITAPDIAFGCFSSSGNLTRITVRLAPATTTFMPYIGFTFIGLLCAIAALIPAVFGRAVFNDPFDFVLIAILPIAIGFTWLFGFSEGQREADRAVFAHIAALLDAEPASEDSSSANT